MSVYCRSTVSKLLVYCRLTVGRLLLGEHACAIEFDLMRTCILDVIKIIIQRTVFIFHRYYKEPHGQQQQGMCVE